MTDFTGKTTGEAASVAAGPDPAARSDIVPFDAAAPSASAMVMFGKIVPMHGEAIDDGVLYLNKGLIVAVRKRGDPSPAGFEGAPRIETGGVIYPGLLDLHNHLAYNILPLWIPPRAFGNRNDWLKLPDYRRFVNTPMGTLTRRRPDLIKSIVRYVETKLLVGGVTSGQGMHSTFGGVPYFQGIVRNFEVPADRELPSAKHKITDLEDEPAEIDKFRRTVQSGKPFFFHLAEGRDLVARAQFELLKREQLFANNLVTIHCAGLEPPDFARLAEANTRVVWSPLSNLLLYGKTLEVKSLLQSGAPFSLGSDWTPSGSRNLLLEMKVATLVGRNTPNGNVSARKLAEAVTIVAARSAGWGDKLGSIEDGKYADLLVLDADKPDPYDNLVAATERDIRLVVIAGHVRYGDEALVGTAGLAQAETEPLRVDGRAKRLNLNHPTSPLNGVTLAKATEALRDEMSDLERAVSRSLAPPLGAVQDTIELELDIEPENDVIAPLAALPPIKSLELDALTIVGDARYFDTLDSIPHLPAFLKGAAGLRSFY
ncbi:amidohydrolase family protein [Bradyrhizobium algeriense]|uniref:amidohydrolase family protein n=1 Tax=Bradyrhizobium algeriense TaxID=634784 RepID=UPI000D3904B5|nr:amidohydrolase family protein [Bradyrhizobium algeriense]